MKIRVFRSFEEAREIWQGFEREAAGYGFQSHAWLSQWQHSIGELRGFQPCLVWITCEQGQPLMLLPLCIHRRYGTRLLTWLGAHVSDYFAPLLARSEPLSRQDMSDLWAQVTRALPPFDVIDFERQPALIEDQPNPFLMLGGSVQDHAYHTVLQPDWESYYAGKANSKTRATDRRKMRRLADRGEVQFVLARTPEDIEAFTRHMVAQKIRRYNEIEGHNVLAAPEHRDFYRQMGQAGVPAGIIQIAALEVGEEVIATHWGMLWGRRYYWLMPTFEGGEWMKYSPGRLLLEHLMQWSFERGYEVFDFTIGAEAYKKQWCELEMPLYEHRTAASARGRAFLALRKLKRSAGERLRAVRSGG